MKIQKRGLLLLLLIIILGLLGIFILYQKRQEISEVEAQNIVLNDIGITLSSIKHISSNRKLEDGKWIYEIKLTIDNTKYEYEIFVSSGMIKKRKKEKISDENNVDSQIITLKKAKEIVLKDANIKKEEAIFTQEKLEDNTIYEIEFYCKETIYKYEIHSKTGEVIKRETEKMKNPMTSYSINLDKAKDIARIHAGVLDPIYKKVELDYEHGTFIYEIEFYQNGIEYEYEIDANTGEIIKYSHDRD